MMLKGYTLFHLNLAFSSIEVEMRPRVIDRCYWPLLRLASDSGLPLAIEASGYTLEAIARLDPQWTATLRALIAAGTVEFVGSGYTQLIGPLVPAEVVAMNLKLGQKTYERLLGLRPTIALVNEQAYSAGLVPLYAAAGFSALVTDYDNCAHYHPEWAAELRYHPQRVQGSDGATLDLLWTHTIAFQKLQRLAHGDITLGEYLAYIRSQAGATPRVLALYSNDAEIFDFRPGRLHTEAPLGNASEWGRVAEAFAALREEGVVTFEMPSALLADAKGQAGPALRLETAACPIPVKKQHKYNVTRWAVTGRDDLDINSRCYRLYDVVRRHGEEEDWRMLCRVWASDYRTHITERRWRAFQIELAHAEALLLPARGGNEPALPVLTRSLATSHVREEGRFIEIETPLVRARLNTHKGLAIDAAWFGEDYARTRLPLCGTLHHGQMEDLSYSPDWFTGSSVLDRPGKPKVTDLERVVPHVKTRPDGAVEARADITTPLGLIRKTMTMAADRPAIDFDILFDWSDWTLGSLRLANLMLLPGAFDPATLTVRTHNGGRTAEVFPLIGTSFDHGEPVSLQVSATAALGMTEGWLDIGDAERRLALLVDKATAAMIGLVTHRPARGQVFCRVALSALEFDETRKPAKAARPRRFRFSLEASAA